jgi:apocytochrome f
MLHPIALVIAIGLVCVSVAGLFVAAVGNWALSARLGVLLAVVGFYAARLLPIWAWTSAAKAFPAFAQQLYAAPVDATGKVACANCHLAEAPLRLSGPSAVFASSVFDLLIEIPVLLAATQVSPSGDPVSLNVGGVVVLPEGFGKAQHADSTVFERFSASEPDTYVFGPVPASEYATTVLSVLAPTDAQSLSYPIVVAGNRGRGQLYPDGSPSNNGGFRSSCLGWTGPAYKS